MKRSVTVKCFLEDASKASKLLSLTVSQHTQRSGNTKSLLTFCLITACQNAFRFLHILQFIVAFCFICLSNAEKRRLGKINISCILYLHQQNEILQVTLSCMLRASQHLSNSSNFHAHLQLLFYEEKNVQKALQYNKMELFLYSIWQNSNRSIRAHTNRRHNSRLQVTVVGFSLRIQPLHKTDSKLSLVRIIIIILSQRS